MTAEPEAAGDALTGAIVGRTIDGNAGAATQAQAHSPSTCLNCGASVSGAYCSNCGQSVHLHRSVASIAHEVLHGVFHFEGKIWRTLPELFFHPGRLTRRYIDGERAKFVSPMALFLFSVFLMFAVFSATGMLEEGGLDPNTIPIASDWKEGNERALATSNTKIEELRARLQDPAIDPMQREQLTKDIADLEAAGAVMKALDSGDFGALAEIDKQQSAAAAEAEPSESTSNRWPPRGSRLDQAITQARDNPKLLMYKVKTNAYKFSWALIPLSVPFLWLLFWWRRDVHVYDHAIFTTYSITFAMLLAIVLSVAAAAGINGAFLALTFMLVTPLHIYKQLRGTYGLSRFGAFVRLVILLIAISIVLSIFITSLLILGALD
jgi:Protein of unknown function (DUF3667)